VIDKAGLNKYHTADEYKICYAIEWLPQIGTGCFSLCSVKFRVVNSGRAALPLL